EGLPKWFVEIDTNKDGQVALYEWRQAGKPMDEFKLWDRNDDGFITIEEAMRYNSIQIAANPNVSAAITIPVNNGNKEKGQDKGGKKGAFGGFFKKPGQ